MFPGVVKVICERRQAYQPSSVALLKPVGVSQDALKWLLDASGTIF